MNRQLDLAFQVLAHLIAARDDNRRLTSEFDESSALWADIDDAIKCAASNVEDIALRTDLAWDGIDPNTSRAYQSVVLKIAAMHRCDEPTREQIRDDQIERGL